MTAQLKRLDRSSIRQLMNGTNMKPDERLVFDSCMAVTSMIWVGMVDNELICVWGLAPPTILSDRAYLWLYTTDKLSEHIFLFVRHSQRAVETMLEEFPLILGHTDPSQKHSIRWLKWLGAEFTEHEGKMLSFEIRKKPRG